MTQDNDYFIDKNGDKRYATGNSLDIQPGALAAPNKHTHKITQDNAHQMLELREDKRRKLRLAAVEKGMTRHPDYETTADCIEDMTASQVELAADSDAGRASTEAFKTVLRVGEYWRDRKEAAAAVVNVLVHIGEGIAAAYGSADAEEVIVSSAEDE